MSLYKQWTKTAFEHKTREEAMQFWNEFSPIEVRIYSHILENHKVAVKGTLQEIAKKFNTTALYIVGFLDGINDSLQTLLEVENLTEESEVELKIDYEKLYYNMWEAQAEELYTLPQWEEVLSVETRKELEKKYKNSKTVVKGEKVGRNDHCPCGSGKKYKKCCLD